MHTGTKIKQLRKSFDMTQEELGELLGVKKAAIQKYEKGEIVNLKLSTIKKLCEVFKITPGSLIFPEAEEFDQTYNSNRLRFEVKTIEAMEMLYGHESVEIMQSFVQLNENGQKRVIEFTFDLMQIDKYRKSSR